MDCKTNLSSNHPKICQKIVFHSNADVFTWLTLLINYLKEKLCTCRLYNLINMVPLSELKTSNKIVFFILLVFNFMQFPSNWFFGVHVQGVAHNPVLLIENIDSRIFYDMQYVTQETALKLIKIKKITSKSDRLLHLNTPVNNFHFCFYYLSISLKT